MDLLSKSSIKTILGLTAGGEAMGTNNIQTVSALTTFNDDKFALWNPAGTFKYIFSTSAIITADKNITIPLLTADGNLVIDSFSNVFTTSQIFNNNISFLQKDTGGTNRQVFKLNGSNALTFGDTAGITGGLIFIPGGNFNWLTVSSVGLSTFTTLAQASTFESLAKFTVSDNTTSYLEFTNNTNTDGQFAPFIQAVTDSAVATTNPTLTFRIIPNVGQDSGTTPLVVFTARRSDATDIATRPIYDFRNNSNSVFKINVKGDVLHTIISQAGVGETLAKFTTSDADANSYFQINNYTTTDANYSTKLIASTSLAASTGPAIGIWGWVTPSVDTSSSTPVINIDARRTDATAILNRPILTVSNLNVVSFRINQNGDILQTTAAQTGAAEICQQWGVSDDSATIVRLSNGFSTDGIFAPVLLFQVSSNVDNGKSACYFYTYINVANDTTSAVPACAFNAGNSNATAIVNRPLFAWRNNSIDVARMNANGDMWNIIKAQSGTAELMHKWTVSDNATAYIQFQNGSATDAVLLPRQVTYNFGGGSSGYGFNLQNYIEAGADSGSTPIFIHDVRRSTEAAITTRLLYEWRNFGAAVLQLGIGYADFKSTEIRNAEATSTLTEFSQWQTLKRHGHIHGRMTTAATFGTELLGGGTIFGSITPTGTLLGNGGLTTAWSNIVNASGVQGFVVSTVARNDKLPKVILKVGTDRPAASRFFLMLKSNATQISAGTTDPLNALGGIAIGWTEADSTYHVWSNSGSGASSDVDTNISATTGVNDGNFLELLADAAGTTWTWNIYNASHTLLGTGLIGTGGAGEKTPTTSHVLSYQFSMEVTDSTATQLLVFSGDIETKH